MSSYSPSIEKLIESFEKLPSIGHKTAIRLAFHMLDMTDEEITEFTTSITDAKKKLKYCSTCFNISDTDPCPICSNPKRDQSTICVVEDVRDIMAMERTHEYKGVYHVLNGLICPSKGIMPDDLNIDSLVKRAADADEIILGTSTTMDGETTSMYLHRLLQEQYPNLNITRIAHGLPSGGLLDYADEMTLAHALSDRRSMK